MGLYFIYDHNFFNAKQLVRDIKKEVYLPSENAYVKKDAPNSFTQYITDFIPKNKQGLLNVYYNAVNAGWTEFDFYCGYDECMNDVNNISTDTILLSNINSYVNTYNQYSTVSTYTSPLLNNKVSLTITRTYNDYLISRISNEVDKIYKNLNLDGLSDRNKILKIHDYLIEHSRYDALKITDINDNTYHSSTAYGLLFEGYAICSGYADTMALFLDKIGIRNIKVASETHVWNLVYLDGKWLHLDLTWDDPYSSDGIDTISHNFFLITYQELKDLKEWDQTEHNFDETIYKEALNLK